MTRWKQQQQPLIINFHHQQLPLSQQHNNHQSITTRTSSRPGNWQRTSKNFLNHHIVSTVYLMFCYDFELAPWWNSRIFRVLKYLFFKTKYHAFSSKLNHLTNPLQCRNVVFKIYIVSVTLDFVNDLADCVDGFSVGAICLVAQEVGKLSYWYNYFADARAYERANRKKPSWRLQLQFSAESFRLVFCELDERVTNDNSTWRHVVDAQLPELRNSFGKIKKFTESMHADALLRELYIKFVHWFIKNLL